MVLAGFQRPLQAGVAHVAPTTDLLGLFYLQQGGAGVTQPNTQSEPKTVDRLPPEQVEEHSRGILKALVAAAKPAVRMMYGAALMFLGGAVSLSDRRLRIGAPRRAAPRIAGTAPA